MVDACIQFELVSNPAFNRSGITIKVYFTLLVQQQLLISAILTLAAFAGQWPELLSRHIVSDNLQTNQRPFQGTFCGHLQSAHGQPDSNDSLYFFPEPQKLLVKLHSDSGQSGSQRAHYSIKIRLVLQPEKYKVTSKMPFHSPGSSLDEIKKY